MSHDARWFMAVAAECGLEKANQLNKIAAREVGKVESMRVARLLDLSPVKNVDDMMFAQEAIISLVGPDLMDYRLIQVDDSSYEVDVQRCFAFENVERAGIAETYECGIFARIAGWLDTLASDFEMNPSLGRCLKACGKNCCYTITIKEPADS